MSQSDRFQGKGLLVVLLVKTGYTYERALELAEELEWACKEKDYYITVEKE